TAADLAVDGSIGPKTWGAIFDCYQFNMAQELGEVDDEADETNPAKLLEGLDRLRGMVTFLPLNEEWIGFGEAHPADGNRKDGAASQQNRRVEILFFESGQEPDVTILKEAPEITELYSPDAFVREVLPPRTGGARRYPEYQVRLLDAVGEPMEEDSGVEYVVWHEGIVLQRSTTFDSWARFRLPPGGNRDVVVIWGPANKTVRFRRRLHVDALLRDGSRRAVECRLEALGYAAGHGDDDKFVEALMLFQE